MQRGTSVSVARLSRRRYSRVITFRGRNHFQDPLRDLVRMSVNVISCLDGIVQPVDLARARNAISYIR